MSNLEAIKGQSTHVFLKANKSRCTGYLCVLTNSSSDTPLAFPGGKNLVTLLFSLIPLS